MRTPDFFIVGAPKCGTTAMHRWLQAHPRCLSMRSPLFWSGRNAAPGHLRCSIRCVVRRCGRRIAGDVAVWYLMSETAADEIHAVNPDARIVIMLRRPHEMLHSLQPTGVQRR